MKLKGVIILRGEVNAGQALELEEYLNGVVANAVADHYGIGLRVHVFEDEQAAISAHWQKGGGA